MISTDRNIQIGRVVTDLIRPDTVKLHLAEASEKAKAILAANPSQRAASVVLPLELFGRYLPYELKSCRLSVMRGGTAYLIERHPNAEQYVLSIEGKGSIRVQSNNDWVVSNLVSGPGVGLFDRWHKVPMNTWHQPAPGEEDWTVVAFHTAPANELKDEYFHDE